MGKLSLAATLLIASGPAALLAQPASVLPRPDAPFTGVAGDTIATSTPAYPAPVRAPEGAPNILIVMTDDTGFGAASTFGGPIPTPNLDRLAREGLIFNRFHTTAMCTPTRAALLTGRNHHDVGMGNVSDTKTGFPGYDAILPRTAATFARVFRDNGYNTAMIGKHHNVPNGELSAAGPFTQWPTGIGFEYFYGFLGGDGNQWYPRLFRGVQRAPAPDAIGENATLDKFFVDDAIDWLHNHIAAAPDKPFLLYLPFGTNHAPHQAPKEWIAKFRGKFDMGWDRIRPQILARQKALGVVPKNTDLTARPAAIPAWDSLTPDQQKVYARMMEVYAAMVAYEDAQFGRLLAELDRTGQRDNTLILFIEGDNGSSPEGEPDGTLNEIGRIANRVPESTAYQLSMLDQMGGPDTYQLYPVGWGWALDTPFQWTKQVGSHLGGTRNGLVVSWPKGIRAPGGIRTQFTHVVDVAPTLYEAAGITPPDTVDGIRQQPIAGISFQYAFNAPKAAGRRTTQYFEMLANRALYDHGWMASTTPARLPWQIGSSGISPLDYKWELYNLDTDFAQAHDLADKYPEKLAEMQAKWTALAKAHQVFPLDDRQGTERSLGSVGPEEMPRARYDYWGPGISAPPYRAPMLGLFPFTLTAEIVVPTGGANGVMLANGSRFAGWSFFLENGRPVVVHAWNQQPDKIYRVESPTALPAGPATLTYRFAPAEGPRGSGGTLTIEANGKEVARGTLPHTAIIPAGLGETLDTGRDTGAPVTDYPSGNRFTGTILRISVEQTLPQAPAKAPQPAAAKEPA